MKKIYCFIRSFPTFIFIVSVVYLIFNIIFTSTIWNQVIYPEKSSEMIIQGESPVYEHVAEMVRLHILSGKNPFNTNFSLLYPFGWNFSIEDIAPINGFYFLILRPFLQIHQSMMLIVVLSIFVSNMSMYILLCSLKIRKPIAFLGGFLYGFTPWVSLRIGAYPSYIALYIFPLVTYFFLRLIHAKDHKIPRAISLGITFVITLLTNLYFTVMLILLAIVSFIFFLIGNKKVIRGLLKKNLYYIFISGITAMVILIPWIIEVYKVQLLTTYLTPSSLTDAIAYSGDLFNLILPSYVNPFYKHLLGLIIHVFPYFQRGIFESFIYPGIIILIGYILIFYHWKKQQKNIKILVFISVGLFIFSLGPFLQIYGKNLHIPLPYLLLHYIPYFQLARAPGRFIILFIFIACIVIALKLNTVFHTIKRKKQIFIFLIIFLIMIIDQAYQGTPPIPLSIPNKIFSYLDKKGRTSQFSVLNIPFTIRDGLKSLGYFHGVWFPRVQSLFHKPIFSIYAGRINDDTFQYYKHNPLFALFDKAINGNQKDFQALFSSAKIDDIEKTVDFLDADYIILKSDEKYYPFAQDLLSKLSYKIVIKDKKYILLYKKNPHMEYFPQNLQSPENVLFFEQGWTPLVRGGRWVRESIATILFKTNRPRPVFLHFKAKSVDISQRVTFYMNKKEVDRFELVSGFKEYDFKLQKAIKKGINILTLKFDHTVKPAEVLPSNKDYRKLAAFFSELNISDTSKKPESGKKEYMSIFFNQSDDEPFLLEGWSDYEKGARWVEGKIAKVQFEVGDSKPKHLILTAQAFYNFQETSIFINNAFIGKVKIGPEKVDEYTIKVKDLIKKGPNIITLKFAHAQRIGKLVEKTQDIRMLSVHIKSIMLK